ncbi:uncharacterized protein EDB91DRAFT_1243701 [Suillus paluster]|uniref:uncharacterized protein n=1 Tax=Suillus paluster TaxID=48578 RepID=UPI001B87FC4D|nr:uncharacterized protein EDB91DRAFT_1243701 [Suillus paluster]KAG1751436.1 hypothetical protein EDB91DRAFT_1243701 [Suillus paluster]
MGSVIQDLLKLPSRRVLLAAQGSLHSCRYIKHLRGRIQPVVEVGTSWRQAHIQYGVRGYASSSSNIKETKSDGFREGDKVISESSSSTDTFTPKQPSKHPLEVQDLPEIPPFPAKPTLHISPDDVTTYIQPLISRQWKVNRVKGVGEDEVLSLNRRYEFKGFNDVMDFVQGVADISREEKARIKHHARIVIEYSTVLIFTHTHSAYTFHRLENGKHEFKKVPGLTRRDIRFAIKTEELHETFKARGRALQFVPAALVQLQRWSMDSLLRRYGKTQKVETMEDVQSTSTSNAVEIQRLEKKAEKAAAAAKTRRAARRDFDDMDQDMLSEAFAAIQRSMDKLTSRPRR